MTAVNQQSAGAPAHGRIDTATGVVLLVTLGLVIAEEAGALAVARALPIAVPLLVLLLALRVSPSRLAFVLTGLGLTVVLVVTDDDWPAVLDQALHVAAFVAAFFTALSTLRNAASTSPAIRACGRFLAAQPPGQRYAALTVGGQLFALILNYGAIQILGSMAMASAREEPNAEIRAIRVRRMLLAVQRAMLATLPWSPLSFAIAISTTLIPGANWGSAILPSFVTGCIMATTGWALDTVFKPRLSGPRPARAASPGDWSTVLPVLLLLVIFFTTVAILQALTGIRIVGLVVVVVPVVAASWIALQHRKDRPLPHLAARASAYVREELPSYRGELTLLMMAAYIGTVGGKLLAPVKAAAGIDLSAVPAEVLLVALVWVIPLAGQFGMNPILASSLLVPILPEPETLGVSPTAVLVAVTAGWALGGATSPFTATTLLVGKFSGKSALHVGLVWNGPFAVASGVLLSVWVVLFASLG